MVWSWNHKFGFKSDLVFSIFMKLILDTTFHPFELPKSLKTFSSYLEPETACYGPKRDSSINCHKLGGRSWDSSPHAGPFQSRK